MKTYTINSQWLSGTFSLERLTYPGTATTAIVAHGDEGFEVLSINLSGYGKTPPSPDQFFVKDYSEHVGLADALVEAGIATKGEPVAIGYGQGYLMTLLPDVQFINKES